MKNFILLFFLLTSCLSYSQKETNIWYFGYNAGLDFNSGSPVVLLDGELNTWEGCATMSDSSGNLLFYTDGRTVYNRNHDVMLNGTGLNGHLSSTHSALIVPKPNAPNIYYIFTVDAKAGSKGLQYSEVDMTLDGGLGGITSNKNILLATPTTEKVTAVKIPNSDSFWIVSHLWNSNKFVAYKISETGVDTTPIESAVGTTIDGFNHKAAGQIKISPDGSKVAVAWSDGLSQVQLFDFSSVTGVVSNPITLLDVTDDQYVFGIEFAPNSKVLYVSIIDDSIYQYNLQAGSISNIIDSKLKITNELDVYCGMQLASDGKIYVAKTDQDKIDVISNPNVIGVGCNFQYEKIYLEGRISGWGLPPFIQSYFDINPFDFQKICFGDETEFIFNDTVDSITWDFDDPASGVDNSSIEKEPIHIFSSAGVYEVSVTATIGNQSATETGSVTIYEQPLAFSIEDQTVCGSSVNGIIEYDLEKHAAEILNGQDSNIFILTYYKDISDYNNNIPIASPNQFVLSSLDEVEPVIRVENINNPICGSFTTFHISVSILPNPSQMIPRLELCDDTSVGSDIDGLVEIDLTLKELDILNDQSSSDFTIKYYTDSTLSNEIQTPSQYHNVKRVETIFVEVTNNTNTECVAISSFELEILGLTNISDIVELKQCDDDLNGLSVFNLEQVLDKISDNQINQTITFYETLSDAKNITLPITNITTYTNEIVSIDKIWARVENNNGCYTIVEINLIVVTTQIPSSLKYNYYACDNDSDGIATFDFSNVENDVLSLLPPGQQPIISFYQNIEDALKEVNAITNRFTYQNSDSPNYQDIYVRVDSELDNSCLGLGNLISLTIETVPIANPVFLEDQCDSDGDGLVAFDTSLIESTLIGSQSNVDVFYFDENGLQLSSPLPNPFTTSTQTITARVENSISLDPNGKCFDETTIKFSVDAAAIAYSIDNLIQCDDDMDGLYPFDTSIIEQTALNGQEGMVVTYSNIEGNILPSPLPNPFLSGDNTITVRVTNPLNTVCFDETSFDLKVYERPQFELDEAAVICMNESPILMASTYNPSGDYSYQWLDENGITVSSDISVTISKGGVYTVIATSTMGCESFPRQITINESELATITSDMVTIVDDSTNNSIRIYSTQLGSGNYEFTLDNEYGFYQDSPIFEGVSAGMHTIFIRDKNNCGISQLEVSVIGYPKFFTPNNDGQNDYWNVLGINEEIKINSTINIFDRFGKILAQVNPNSDGWDGYYNGVKAPATDYWFSVEFTKNDGTIIVRKGHFSIVRR